MQTPRRSAVAAVALVLAGLLLVACGDGEDGGPSVDPTRSPSELPSPTRSPTRADSPTEAETVRESTPPADSSAPSTRSPRPTRTATRTPTSSPSADDSPTEAADDSSTTATDTDGEQTPTWVWVLLALLGAGLVAGIPLVVRSRRRTAWRSDLAAAEREVAWLARELVPELRRAGSGEQLAGGWAVSSARVRTLEDRLTALEATARDDPGRERARTLRDAVRAAAARVETLATSSAEMSPSVALDSIAVELESALRRTG